MGRKTNRRSVPTRVRSNVNKRIEKQTAAIKLAAKKKHQQWSKDRLERVRDALNRDAALLYDISEDSNSLMPSPVLQTDSVVSLAESMQGLGR